MGKTERDDNPYSPPPECTFDIDEATPNEPCLVPSRFSIKFVVFAVACNLMFGGLAAVLGSGGARAAFGAEVLVFYGTPALNLALVFVGLFAIGCVKLGKKSLDLKRALTHVLLTTLLCYVTVMIVYFCREGQFLSLVGPGFPARFPTASSDRNVQATRIDLKLGQECPSDRNRGLGIGRLQFRFLTHFAYSSLHVYFKLQRTAREGVMSLLLERIRKSYREPGGNRIPVLGIERFAMNQGEQVALIGASGGGKTTLLNIISGILTPDSGRVVVDGSDIATKQEVVRDRFRAAKIGIVFQTFNLLPAFSALENVLLGMSFSGRSVDKAFAKQLLERVGLGHRLHHSPQKLSVGEQQRVAVARSLANKPVLLLADEPTANVDLANQQLILDLIRDTCRDHNVTLLMVTHSSDVAGTFARVENMKDFNRPELCLQEQSA